MISQKEVITLFNYNPLTGVLTNRRTSLEVGSIKSRYKMVYIKGKMYYVHRIIWLWYYGYFPENCIDHINGDGLDNRLTNLREVSRSCNRINSNKCSNSTTVVGVNWHKLSGKWVVRICSNNKLKVVGYFSNFEEAVFHRYAAEQCLDFPNCNSTSTSLLYIKEFYK